MYFKTLLTLILQTQQTVYVKYLIIHLQKQVSYNCSNWIRRFKTQVWKLAIKGMVCNTLPKICQEKVFFSTTFNLWESTDFLIRSFTIYKGANHILGATANMPHTCHRQKCWLDEMFRDPLVHFATGYHLVAKPLIMIFWAWQPS